MMRDFRKLNIWKEGMQLVKAVYLLTNDFPESEKFGLSNQMRRAAVSIPSNIAEGSSRNSEIEFKRFLEIAIGSSYELETQLLISFELNYIDNIVLNKLIDEMNSTQKQINSLISIIKKAKG